MLFKKLIVLVFFASISAVASANSETTYTSITMEIRRGLDINKCRSESYDQAEGYAVLCRFESENVDLSIGKFIDTGFSDDFYEYVIRTDNSGNLTLLIFKTLWIDDGDWSFDGLENFYNEVINHFTDTSPEIFLKYQGPELQTEGLLEQVDFRIGS